MPRVWSNHCLLCQQFPRRVIWNVWIAFAPYSGGRNGFGDLLKHPIITIKKVGLDELPKLKQGCRFGNRIESKVTNITLDFVRAELRILP